jgi:hypothetical protein
MLAAQVVHQEGHGDLVQLVDDEGVRELPPEGHQMVGGDGAGDQQRHGSDTTVGYWFPYQSVTPSVAVMTYSTPGSHLTYAELSTPSEMAADARGVVSSLRLERVVRAVTEQAPSIHFEDYPREVEKHEIRVSAAAARIANALHLHLD